MSTHARPLAEWLAAASDDDLSALFRARGVRADAAWHDFFDAAEGLLDQGSIAKALAALTRPEAIALVGAAHGEPILDETRDALLARGLLRPDGTPWAEVLNAIDGRTVPSASADAPPPASDASASAHAAERAFTTLGAVADLILLARERPIALLTGGAVNAGERKTLVENGVPAEAIDAVMAIAVDGRLAAVDERRLRPTVRAEEWLRSSAAERWDVVASGFRDALPRGVRTPSGGWISPAGWAGAHPWDPTWPERATAIAERARLLGLMADDGSEPAWAAALRTGAEPDSASLASLLPAEVDRIFLQNDLTAIAPGPLAPALDVRLRTIAARESAAQASTYRFTPESVAKALVLGETEQGILEFLGHLSLTGIPQPLQYLVTRAAQRHGLVRVSSDAETGYTRIESSDETLVQAMAVDQALRPLALSAHESALTTRVARDTVYWALVDARYPATLVADDGTVLSGERHAPLDAAPPASADYAPLIATLRAHQGPDADAAWLDRELEAAVRARALLRVTVGMPDGSARDLVLEATGLGGGRLRGLDRTADVERTLPVSSIRAATVIEP